MTPGRARWLVVLAAVLWSTSTVFLRLLQEPTVLNLQTPALSPLQIAFFRSLFAGLVLLLVVPRSHMTFQPRMAVLILAFGIMTALYLTAIGLGPAANAILLQNTAPVWIYFLGVYLLGDPKDTRSFKAVLLGLAGAVIIVAGNWPTDRGPDETRVQIEILLMAAGSGVFYAFVVLLLRSLNAESATWLTVLCMLGSAAVIAVFIVLRVGWREFENWLLMPSPTQLGFIALYGVIQLAWPYVLFARGLKAISPQEAGIITLIEPLLNPLWAWLLVPERETPTVWTAVGGAVLFAALVWRYWPRRVTDPASSG